jgi:hypothetical protein
MGEERVSSSSLGGVGLSSGAHGRRSFFVGGGGVGGGVPNAQPELRTNLSGRVRGESVVSMNSVWERGELITGRQVRPERRQEEMFEADWTEATVILREARVQVTALRYPIIRDMFLSLATREQQLRFILACSKDLGFNHAQVSQLCSDRPEISKTIVCSLFPSIRGRTSQLVLLEHSYSNNLANLKAVAKEVKVCLWFQEGNMTGRYNLDLSKPADYTVAENCLLCNAWESEVARAQGRPDMSQRGNYETLRNEAWNEVPFTYDRGWSLPNRGSLRFDFSSVRRPPLGTQAMTEATEAVKYLKHSHVAGEAKLHALRAISVHSYLSTQQFKNLILCFADGEERRDFFCALHTRVVDSARLLGPELFYSPQIFRDTDRAALIKRIGHLHLLNPLHPDGVTFVCDLLVFEERMVVDFLVQLTVKEPGGKVNGYGNNDKYAAEEKIKGRGGGAGKGVLASWAGKGVPAEDVVFTCSYETTNVNAVWRQQLAEQYCGPQFGTFDRALGSHARTSQQDY